MTKSSILGVHFSMWIHTSTFCNICIYRYCVSPLLLHRFNLVLVHKIKKLIKQV